MEGWGYEARGGLILKAFVVGLLSTNCYLIADAEAGEGAIIDPGIGHREELDPLLREVGSLGVDVVAIINTHGHPDHTAGNPALKASTGAEILIHETDAPLLLKPMWPWPGLRPMRPDRLLVDGDEVRVGGSSLRVIHTPGHTVGSISLYHAEAGLVFTGDTLFAGSVGRTDFRESSPRDMPSSLARLAELPGQTMVYPGHGPPTRIGVEREENPFVRASLSLTQK